MNKFLLTATAALLAVTVAMPAAAAVNARQVAQRNSIDAGVRSGKLTPYEARVLRQEQNLITRAKVRTKDRHGGNLTDNAEKRIHDMQDAAERHINRLKSNRNRAPSKRILGAKVF